MTRGCLQYLQQVPKCRRTSAGLSCSTISPGVSPHIHSGCLHLTLKSSKSTFWSPASVSAVGRALWKAEVLHHSHPPTWHKRCRWIAWRWIISAFNCMLLLTAFLQHCNLFKLTSDLPERDREENEVCFYISFCQMSSLPAVYGNWKGGKVNFPFLIAI